MIYSYLWNVRNENESFSCNVGMITFSGMLGFFWNVQNENREE